MESNYTEGEVQSGSRPIDQVAKHQEVVWSDRQPAGNVRSRQRLKDDADPSLEGFTSAFANERDESAEVRFGFLKIRAIQKIGPERIEVELELTPAAARDPIDLESLGLRDIQIATRESAGGRRSVWLTGSGYFFGSVGDTIRLVPTTRMNQESRPKVYWRKTYLIDVVTRDTDSQTSLDLLEQETTRQYIVDLVSRSPLDQCRPGGPGDSDRAKSAAQCQATEFALKTGGPHREVVAARCSLLLREPVSGIADHRTARIRVRAR
jgi:hypothetical protein